MLRWLTRLFRQRDEAETAPATAPPLPEQPSALAESTQNDAVAVVEPGLDQVAVVGVPDATASDEGKETCPTCGRTSVFAGPPGQRFCTYCALRDELFERSAAASE